MFYFFLYKKYCMIYNELRQINKYLGGYMSKLEFLAFTLILSLMTGIAFQSIEDSKNMKAGIESYVISKSK
jgi:hypothetical protein